MTGHALSLCPETSMASAFFPVFFFCLFMLSKNRHWNVVDTAFFVPFNFPILSVKCRLLPLTVSPKRFQDAFTLATQAFFDDRHGVSFSFSLKAPIHLWKSFIFPCLHSFFLSRFVLLRRS